MNPESIAYINNLPLEYLLNYNGVNILCVHGTPRSIIEAIDKTVPINEIKEIIKDVKEDIILCGHSHCSFIGEVDGKKVFNVGSIGNSLDGDNRASYGILNFSDDNIELITRKISYSMEKLFEIAEKNNFPNVNVYKSIIEKQTVDILLEIDNESNIEQLTDNLIHNGWGLMSSENKPSMKMAFNKGYIKEGFAEKVYHLHVRYSDNWNELYFRDYLMEHEEVAKEYGNLKLELIEKYEHDRDGYTDAKSDFVLKYTEKAKDEYGERYNPRKKDDLLQF